MDFYSMPQKTSFLNGNRTGTCRLHKKQNFNVKQLWTLAEFGLEPVRVADADAGATRDMLLREMIIQQFLEDHDTFFVKVICSLLILTFSRNSYTLTAQHNGTA